ncbi:Putative oxidoreductase [Pseudomonas chlororaphis]|uniref:Oxidoreductase n=1 Tax=Pseudomonas chlororaphis TaxID=587753 RepID=A0A3G7TMP2_9PSED|nr:alcohol dehydrogenase catalytic domain-containing protein [Pseudomonas chlororaphis]AZE48151.1 Putative oxidoreductase [Pseudomonas chlororaphis]
MHALQFSRTGDLSSLHYVEVPTPVPAADQVLVRIKAAGLNPSDVKNVLGLFPYTTVPRIPGRDFAGVVVDGPRELVGQEVWGTGKELGFYADGSHAQYVALPASVAALAPFGRIAIIAAPVDGHVQLPALGLYRKGGSVVGINSLLYGVQACAAMLEQFGRFFDEGLLPLPQGLFESPLEQGVERYHEVNRGSGEKVILLP